VEANEFAGLTWLGFARRLMTGTLESRIATARITAPSHTDSLPLSNKISNEPPGFRRDNRSNRNSQDQILARPAVLPTTHSILASFGFKPTRGTKRCK
jgi:hypothetical protein